MAAPSFVDAGTGATDAGGAWSYTCQASGAAGNIFIVQVLKDGTTTTPNDATFTGATNIEDLAGADNAWTLIPGFTNSNRAFRVGAAATPTGMQYLLIGRALSTSAPTISGGNGTSEDLYIRSYQFSDVNTGATLANVIENVTAGVAAFGSDTSTTCSDTAVTTLGADRLACNFGALSDDLMGIAVFTGMTGGTWGDFQVYEEASGTDGTVFAEFATMASAGTIDGGSDTITSIGWGVVGFALIGTTSDAPDTLNTNFMRKRRGKIRQGVQVA